MLAEREAERRFCLIWGGMLENVGERRHLVWKIAAIVPCVSEMLTGCEVLRGLAWLWQTRSKTIFQSKRQFKRHYCLPTRL